MSRLDRFARLMLNYPQLWDPTDINYRDNTLKARARAELLIVVNRLSRVQITMVDLKRKIKNFCSNRRRKMVRWEIGLSTNPLQCKANQKQYSLVLHAQFCREQRDMECPLQSCQAMRGLVNHMERCQAGEFCPTPDCRWTVRIMTHWGNCRKEICPICSPQKEWHKTITTAQRKHIVDVMLQSVSSNEITPMIHYELAYVKKWERDTFKSVNSRTEYYRTLSDKMWLYELYRDIMKQSRAPIRRSIRV